MRDVKVLTLFLYLLSLSVLACVIFLNSKFIYASNLFPPLHFDPVINLQPSNCCSISLSVEINYLHHDFAVLFGCIFCFESNCFSGFNRNSYSTQANADADRESLLPAPPPASTLLSPSTPDPTAGPTPPQSRHPGCVCERGRERESKAGKKILFVILTPSSSSHRLHFSYENASNGI